MQLRKFIKWFLKSDEPKARRARRFGKLGIILVLFIALFWVVPVESVIEALLKTDPVLFIVGVILALLKIFLSSVQMKPLLDSQKIDRSTMQIFKINLAVKFYLLLMPTTLIASGYRWYRFAQPEGKVTESFVALAFYRLFRTFLTLSLGLGFLLISIQQNIPYQVIWIILLLLAIVVFWIVVTRYSLPVYNWIRSRSGIILDRSFWQPILRIVEKLLKSASAYAEMPLPVLLYSMAAGIMSDLTGIAANLFLAQAVGISLGFLELGWVMAIVNLASQITLSIMEGLGVREVTLVAVLSVFGISAEQAVAFSFLIFSRGVIISAIGGVIEAVDTLRTRRKNNLKVVPSDTKEI